MGETEIGGDGRGFRSTLWTVVLRAKDEAGFPGAVFRKGKPVLLRYAVRKGSLEVLVDGRRAWLR